MSPARGVGPIRLYGRITGHVAIGTAVHDTAILFFSHRPEREWQNKRFVRQDYDKHQRVARTLYRHARRAVDSSPFPVFEVNGDQQRGDDFGSRLTNAFVDAFAQGYDRVIAVGSDCPRVHEVDWAGVGRRLEAGTPVLGPTSEEKGAYLIGMNREHFEPAGFEALPWTTSALFARLADHLTSQAGTAPALLAVRDDVNDHHQLLSALHSAASLPPLLVRRIRHVLGVRDRTIHVAEAISARRTVCRRSRAPPL